MYVCITRDVDASTVTLCPTKNAVRSYPVRINHKDAKICSRKLHKNLRTVSGLLIHTMAAPQMRNA